MNSVTLDKWLLQYNDDSIDSKDAKEIQRTYVFVDLQDLDEYFRIQNRQIHYEKLIQYIKNTFNVSSNIYFYDGIYQKEELDEVNYEIQQKSSDSLNNLGINASYSIKYFRDKLTTIIKGNEVLLATDMVQFAHNKQDYYDRGILICGNHFKYRHLVQFIESNYNKKITIVSLSQEYENNHKSYLDIVAKIGIEREKNSLLPVLNSLRNKTDFVKIQGSDVASLREKYSNRKIEVNKKKCYLFIDYGNVYHHLKFLKRRNQLLKNITEKDFIVMVKKRAEQANDLIKTQLFTGMPHLLINDYDELRKKKENMVKALESYGIDVFFNYNEVSPLGMKELGVDLRIAINILHFALENKFEKVILVSGDADFFPLIKKLKDLNKTIEIWSFTRPANNSPLSPYLCKEIQKYDFPKSSIKSLNTMFRC